MSIQNRGLALLAVLVLGLGGYFAATPAAAAEQNIAVVDVQMLLTQTPVAQSIQKQVQEGREALQSEVAEYDKELMEAQKALVEMRSADNQDEFNKKRQELEQKIAETRRIVQAKKRALNDAFLEAEAKLQTAVLEIITEVAKAKGYDMVLARRSVVFMADDARDISAEVKKRLEASLTHIDLTIKE